ncbi:Coiled-coil and C2 domain-containing protein 2A, partial [Entophlyctis luteolus]
MSRLLFYPEKYIIPRTDSMAALFEVRFPDEEGLYVGRFPAVKSQNLTKMERRLRSTEENHGAEWFGPDQRLAAIPNPKRLRTQRPGAPPPLPVAQGASPIDSTSNLSRSSLTLRGLETEDIQMENENIFTDNMALVLRKASYVTSSSLITDSSNGMYTLVFSLGCIVFNDHPLISEECRLAKDVEEWIYVLRARRKADIVGYLTKKLETLKIAYNEYVERTEKYLNSGNSSSNIGQLAGIDQEIYPAKPVASKYHEKAIVPRLEEERERMVLADAGKRKEFRDEIRSTRLLRDSEAHRNRLLEFKILQAWEKIKKIRKDTGMITSSIRVTIRARQPVTSEEEDKLQFQNELENELLELEEIHDAELERKTREYKLLLKDWRKRRDEYEASRSNEPDTTGETTDVNYSGIEKDPLADTDEDESMSDDGRSGYEWLRLSTETVANKDKRIKKGSGKEKAKSEVTPTSKFWDFFSRSESPTKSAKENVQIDIPLSIAEESKETPRNGKKPNFRNDPKPTEKNTRRHKIQRQDSDQFESNEAIESTRLKPSFGSSTKLSEDTRKWRSASRTELNSPLKLRRPSVQSESVFQSSPNRVRLRSPARKESKSASEANDAPPKSSKSRFPKKKAKSSASINVSGFKDPVPVAPIFGQFNPEKARAEIIKRLEVSFRPPGAPILSLGHVNTEHVTEFLQCTKEEQHRRKEIESIRVFAIFYYNNKEITRTIPQPVDIENFVVVFKGMETMTLDDPAYESVEMGIENANVFGARVKEKPNSITAALYELIPSGSRLICEVYLPIPEPSETVVQHDRQLAVISFSGRPFTPGHKTIEPTYSQMNRWTAGTLKLNIAWGVGQDGKSLGPLVKQEQSLTKYTDPLFVKGSSGLLNVRKLMDWIMDVKFDPNDPRNQDVLRLKQLVQMGGSDGLSFHNYWNHRKVFRLQIPTKISHIAFEGLQYQAKRLFILKQRNQRQITVKAPVPFNDKDIADDLYEKIANPLEDEAAALSMWKPKSSNSKNTQSSSKDDSFSEATGFLKRIRMHQLIQRARQSRPYRVEDFVREERLAEAQAQENMLSALFMPKRPLKPLRLSRLARLTLQPDHGCKIMIHVLRGMNVPTRKIEQLLNTDDRDKQVRVQSYVEVSFQEQKTRTQVFEGPNPHWNETLFLDVKPPNNNFSPESLLDSEVGMERIYFHIFDESLVDINQDDRDRDFEIHQRRERNWLGSFSMPFTVLHEQTKIEGAFQVKSPPVLLGYDKNAGSSVALENAMFLGLDTAKETVVDLFIALEPPLAQPAPLKLRFLSDEDDRFLRYASQWCKPPFMHSSRQFVASALDLSGRTTFVCRYIRPQDPPPELLTPRHLLRYVSSIPYLPDRTAFSADVSLWATSDQMLELRAGDAAEHAILLCNFLLAKGGHTIDVFVVIGSGIPEGRTAYVAMRSKVGSSEMTLMNAVTGESYHVRDAHLPLKSVKCIFNELNLWANIQAYEDPARLNWNVDDVRSWKPFFCKKFPKFEYKSVQVDKLVYREISAKYCQNLSISIENAVVAKIEEWRGHRITRWNRLVAKKNLQPLVARMESDFLQPLPSNTPQHMTPFYHALADLKSTYRISGFPLHTTFTDIKAVVELVGATDVHMNADPSAEFALSV